ncbi:MAG: amidohydrolase family protein [Candidatus Melainabacteria bacterium]
MQVLLARWVLPVDAPPIPHGFVAIKDGRISGVGPIASLPAHVKRDYNPATNRTLITPGLINTHTHLEQSCGERIPKGPDDRMADWLMAFNTTLSDINDPAVQRAHVRNGLAEMVATGTTTVNDISRQGTSLQVLDEMGLRGMVAIEYFHGDAFELNTEKLTATADLFLDLQEEYEEHPRLSVGLSPHSPYNVSPKAWRWMTETCQPAFIHTHLAESMDELRFFRGDDTPESGEGIYHLHKAWTGFTYPPAHLGDSPIEYLYRFGLLDVPTIAAHAIYTTEADRQLLARFGVRVSHCPRSNLYLQGASLAWRDWERLSEYHIAMGLGTDGHTSTETLDLRDEARAAMALHGWSAAGVLKRMTLEGAKVLGLKNSIGSLATGKAADVVVWQAADNLSPVAWQQPADRVLDATTTVQQVLVNGQPVYTRELQTV